jgi:ABC-type multidrug transport system fused ATPase/permease subunit
MLMVAVHQSLRGLLNELLGHISIRRRVQLFVVFLVMVTSTFFELIALGAIVPFLTLLATPEKVFENTLILRLHSIFGPLDRNQLQITLTLFFTSTVVFSCALRLILIWMLTRVSFAIGADLGLLAYRKTLYQPYVTHISRNTSEVISGVLNKAGNLVYTVILPLLHLVLALLVLSGILILLVVADPKVSLLTFSSFGLIYLIIYRLAQRQLLRDGQRIPTEQTQVLASLQEGLGGIRDVLIDGAQETYLKAFQRADSRLRRSQANVSIIGNFPRAVLEAAGLLVMSIVAYYLATESSSFSDAVPVLGVMALGAQRILPLLQQVYYSMVTLRSSESTISEALVLLSQPFNCQKAINQNQTTPLPFKTLSFRKVSFKYPEGHTWVLKDIDFELKRGSRLGVVGTTGGGKSTLLDLLMGLLSPTEGSLWVDDTKLCNDTVFAWQKLIAHVPQTIFLVDSTVAANIAYGVDPGHIDFERVKEAAVQAQIADAIESWPAGYQTLVGERGIKLSGGQRQRIAIARALYKKAELIIFDEATSALDNETERAIMAAIDSLPQSLTIIIAAHRLTTLVGCDHIIKVNNGTITLDPVD